MYSKQIYKPRETFKNLLSPEITPLPTKPLLSYYPLGILQAWTMSYKENTYFAEFLMTFLLEIWIYTLAFPYVSQDPLLKASKGHIKILGPWCSFCCISSSLTKILVACSLTWPSRSPLFFLFYYYYFFLFPSFGTLGLHGPS